MSAKYRHFVWLAVCTLVLHLVDRLKQYPDDWIWQVLPNAIFRLNYNHFLGLLVTFLASGLAWAFAILIGWSLGSIAASFVADSRNLNVFRRSGRVIDKIYDGLWVTPFVLTISFAYAIGMRLHTNAGLAGWLFALGMISVAGGVLGGYNIYKSIYKAVTEAKHENRLLVFSLYSKHDKSRSRWEAFLQSFVLARRFGDCEIRAFCNSLPVAFYLSVVAVMILEMVTPQFYELVFPQTGPVTEWLGGAGRQILQAQQTYSFETMAGVIWLVIFVTWFVTAVTEWTSNRLWLRFYAGEVEA